MSDYAARYLVLAVTAGGKGALNFATDDVVRAGVGYQAAIQNVPGMTEQFVGAVLRSNTVTLSLALPPGDPARSDVLDLADGTPWTVTTVFTRQRGSEAPVEVVHSRTLKMSGLRVSGLTLAVTLADIDDSALETLHPPLTWTADNWATLDSDHAGLTIPDPTGTALHVTCPLLDDDPGNSEWFYGVCTGDPVLLTIADATGFPPVLYINGDHRDKIAPGSVFYWIHPSAAFAGRHVVGDVSYAAGQTILLLPGFSLPGSGWVGTQIRLMPNVLTVYRNGRVVPPTEYEVVHSHAPGTVTNGDFATGTLAGWTVESAGSGSAAVVSGAAQITSSNASNYRYITQSWSSITGLFHAVRARCEAGGADAAVNSWGILRRVPAGSTRTRLVNNTVNGGGTVRLGVSGNAGTTRVDDVSVVPHNLVLIRFTGEQRDFQGSPYTITADVQGTRSRNVAHEIQRLLVLAGVAVNAASFSAAAIYADANGMQIDADYGRDGQRSLRAILDDLCFIARATLTRNAAGEYVLVQDRVTLGSTELDDAVDAVAVDDVQWRPQRPATVELSYRPGSAEPSRLQHTLTRPVAGGTGGVQRRAVRYLRDHVAADRLLCYLQKRAEYARAATVQRLHAGVALGENIVLRSALLPAVLSTTVWRADSIAQGWRLELREYDAAIHVYTPGKQQADALPGYSPDYSRTPPLAPTGLAVTSSGSTVASDGPITARVALVCTAPAVNWTEIWFAAVHTVTGEIIMARGDVSGATATVTLTGLRPGESYQVRAWAVNATGLRGPSATVAHTAAGHPTLPPNVSSINRSQGTGLLVDVRWAAVAIDNLREYVLERRVGSGAYAEVWRGRATHFVDRDVYYAGTFNWRVRAVDTWGNASAGWATSAALTVTRNVSGGSGGDIMDNTVATLNRTNVSTVSQLVTFDQIRKDFTLVHGLGRIPLPSPRTASGHIVSVVDIDNTTCTVSALQAGWGLDLVDGTVGTHTHPSLISLANKALVMDFW